MSFGADTIHDDYIDASTMHAYPVRTQKRSEQPSNDGSTSYSTRWLYRGENIVLMILKNGRKKNWPKEKSGRRDSNPRQPAWKVCVHNNAGRLL